MGTGSPNIVGVVSIKAESQGFALGTTSDTSLLTVSDNKGIKINNIIVANVHGTNSSTIDVKVTKENYTSDGVVNTDTSGTFHLAKNVSVATGSSLVVLDTPIYLMEFTGGTGDILKAKASVASVLEVFVSYEVLDDA